MMESMRHDLTMAAVESQRRRDRKSHERFVDEMKVARRERFPSFLY